MTSLHDIVSRLRAVARLEQVWYLVHGAMQAIAVSMLLALVLTGAEALLHGTSVIRTVFWYAWVLGTATAAGVWMSRPLATLLSILPLPRIHAVALRVGQAYPDVRDTLANAVQLADDSRADSSELIQAAIGRGLASASDKDFTVIIEKDRVRRALFWALLCSAVLSVALFIPPMRAALERIVHHERSYVPKAPFTIQVQGGADTVMRGTSSWIDVTIEGAAPQQITLWIREEPSTQFVAFPITVDTLRMIRHQLPSMTSSVTFYAEAGWYDDGVRSDTMRIVVLDRPLLRGLSGAVIPPAYTRIAATPITELAADVTALRGSVVDLTATSSKPLREATILVRSFQDSTKVDTTRIPMSVDGTIARGRFSVTRPGTYSILLMDRDGQTTAEPVDYAIAVLSDAYPTIVLRTPTSDRDIDPSAKVPLTVSISDDYGFSSLRLFYRLAQSRYAEPDRSFQSVTIPIVGSETSLDVNYLWDLARLGMTAEDRYEYYLEVADNDAVSGPKTAKTTVLTVRMPSLEEVFAETDVAQTAVQQELEQVVREAEELRKEADELRREMQKQQAQSQRQTDWSDRKKAEDLVKRQEQLEQRMEEAVQKLEQMTDKLEQNKAISPETLEKYKELQELMKKVDSPELRRMQEQMKQAMEQLSPEEMERMMQQFTFDEEKFRQNIERTLKLLKRTQAEQKADELAKRAEQLAEQQEELRKQTENANPNDRAQREQLSKQQDRLQKELDRLSQESKELEKLMKEIGNDMPMNTMESAKQDLNAQQTSEQMQQAQEQMEQGQMEQAASEQQKASNSIQKFAQQMRQMQKQMRRNANREAMRTMQKGMQDMVALSKQQEQLMQSMRSMDPSSAQFRQAAQQQQRLQQAMQSMSNSMFQLSQRSTSVSPELAKDLGDALQSMQQALQAMQDRNSAQASQQQGSAMQSMNSAAQRMSSALGQMMQGEGGSGGMGQSPGQGQGQGPSPFQRLQQLAQDQSGINQGSQNIGQGGGGGTQMSEQQRAEMGRLAAQQGKALRALQELDQQTRQQPGGKKPIGNLQQIAEDMKEVMSDMQTGSITPETRMRQERILSRLLNASRSMNERDFEKTRESQVGQDVQRDSPDALSLDVLRQNTPQQRMQQAERTYTRDYQLLIRRYFELLQQRR